MMPPRRLAKRTNTVLTRNFAAKLFEPVKPTSIEEFRKAVQEAVRREDDYVRSQHGE